MFGVCQHSINLQQYMYVYIEPPSMTPGLLAITSHHEPIDESVDHKQEIGIENSCSYRH